MFILILEFHNISKHIFQLLFIYVARNICDLLYHAFTHEYNFVGTTKKKIVIFHDVKRLNLKYLIR
jgi:hypothetical protein